MEQPAVGSGRSDFAVVGNPHRSAGLPRADPAELDAADLWRRAALSEQYREGDTGRDLFRMYAAREPEDRDADYVLAQILLNADDRGGLEYVERAAEKFSHALGIYRHAYAFHQRRGEAEQAEAWRLRIEAQIDRETLARVERGNLSLEDTFVPCELSEEWLNHLREQFTAHKDVVAAWVCCKQVTVVPAYPLYVIAFKRSGWGDTKNLAQRLADNIEVPGECLYVARAGDTKAIANKVSRDGIQIL